MCDVEEFGLVEIVVCVLELVWKDVDVVYILFDIDSVDCGFVLGIGWLELGGFLLCEVLELVLLVVKEGICGFEVVEVLLFYDIFDIMVFFVICVIVDVFGMFVFYGKMGLYKGIIDKLVLILVGLEVD